MHSGAYRTYVERTFFFVLLVESVSAGTSGPVPLRRWLGPEHWRKRAASDGRPLAYRAAFRLTRAKHPRGLRGRLMIGASVFFG